MVRSGWSKYYSDDGALFVRAQDINTDSFKLDSVAHVSMPKRGGRGGGGGLRVLAQE